MQPTIEQQLKENEKMLDEIIKNHLQIEIIASIVCFLTGFLLGISVITIFHLL